MDKKQYPDTSPVLAFVMSLCIPSSGQYYNKQPLKALAALISFITGIFLLSYVGWLLWVIWSFIAADATLTSLHYRKERRKALKDFF
ncbi:hypothetical protein HYG86_08015 [Alkalicella caledoniensis]|uniref:TM2 domain-containing protein n=1 Tax=Alkalicella caledoniensis TaxID=2731377 RepID=A0A7G9W7S4_ALKCA|nr:hypothetical protein [Alkalicella caledoniensis]QNO14736.1 hypothetical protein HYG86_08015 [Alkalicella caledoniensis]